MISSESRSPRPDLRRVFRRECGVPDARWSRASRMIASWSSSEGSSVIGWLRWIRVGSEVFLDIYTLLGKDQFTIINDI